MAYRVEVARLLRGKSSYSAALLTPLEWGGETILVRSWNSPRHGLGTAIWTGRDSAAMFMRVINERKMDSYETDPGSTFVVEGSLREVANDARLLWLFGHVEAPKLTKLIGTMRVNELRLERPDHEVLEELEKLRLSVVTASASPPPPVNAADYNRPIVTPGSAPAFAALAATTETIKPAPAPMEDWGAWA